MLLYHNVWDDDVDIISTVPITISVLLDNSNGTTCTINNQNMYMQVWVCMCVCECVCVAACVGTCVGACVGVYVGVRGVNACMSVWVSAYMSLCICVVWVYVPCTHTKARVHNT